MRRRRIPAPIHVVLALGAAAVWAVYLTLFRLPPVDLVHELDVRDVPAARCRDCTFAQRLATDSLRIFTPLASLPPAVPAAIVAAEDQRFWQHGGIDWQQVRRAVERNVGARGYRVGASTITMQLARTLFLSRQRRLVRKLREAAYALALERRWPKAKILEAYLNQVDFGRGLRGIGAAACHYLGRPATTLTPEDATALAGILPSPDRRGARLARSPCARTP